MLDNNKKIPKPDKPTIKQCNNLEEDVIIAKSEEASLKDIIDLERKTEDHRRGEKIRNIVVDYIRYIILPMGAIVLVVFCWHHLAPEKLHWLDDEVIQVIENAMFGGIFISAFGAIWKKYFD